MCKISDAQHRVQVEYHHDGDTIVAAFGSDASTLDGTDRAEVQDALRGWLPDVEVLDVASHDWVADPTPGRPGRCCVPGSSPKRCPICNAPKAP